MRLDIHVYIHQENETVLTKLIKEILNITTNTMSKVTDIEAKVDALQTKLDEEQAEIQTAIDALNATVQELRDQIAGGAGDAEALERIATKLDNITTDLEATVTPSTPEEPQP